MSTKKTGGETMTDEELKMRYRMVVRRGRVFAFVLCPLAALLVISTMPLSRAIGFPLGGTAVLVLWLATCAGLAFMGFSIARCPACGAYVGSPPVHRWGKPRGCGSCGRALS